MVARFFDIVKKYITSTLLITAAVFFVFYFGCSAIYLVSLPTSQTDYGIPSFLTHIESISEDGRSASDTHFHPLSFMFHVFAPAALAFLAGRTWPRSNTEIKS